MTAQMPIIRVTARDLELGDEGVKELAPGQFVVVCAEPIRVVHEQRYDDGTVFIVLKPNTSDDTQNNLNENGGAR